MSTDRFSHFRKLERYFESVAYERSTSGPMFERGELYNVRGIAAHRGVRISSLARDPKHRHEGVSEDDEVIRDDGRGIPAYITAETQISVREEPDGRDLKDYGFISRLLMELERVDRRSAQAIELYFGNDAVALTGKPSPLNRNVALYPLCAAGQTLVRLSLELSRKGGSSKHVAPMERIENMVAHSHALGAEVAEQARLAALQAERLLQRAERAWNDVCDVKSRAEA